MPLRTDFSRSASRYDEAAVLARESGQRMAERLDLVKLEPRRIADVGCATGDGLRELQQRYPKAQALAPSRRQYRGVIRFQHYGSVKATKCLR